MLMAFDQSSPLSMPLEYRHSPKDMSDRVAYGLTKMLRFFADVFFNKRYGHRAVVLETVAAVPGMVGGMLNHLKSLRRFQDVLLLLINEIVLFIELRHQNRKCQHDRTPVPRKNWTR